MSYPAYRTVEEARAGNEAFRQRMIEALGWNPWTPRRQPSTELESWHYWPDCFTNRPCYYCLWWDICWALADVGIYMKGPEQW